MISQSNNILEFSRSISHHRKVIDDLINFSLTGNNHTIKKEFEDPFNYHLSDLNGFIIHDKITHKKFSKLEKFTKNDYQFVETFIFHNSNLLESKPPIVFDESILYNVTDYFFEKIKKELTKDEMASDQYKYFINTTYSIIDSFYQYELMHPDSRFNPWSQIFDVCSKGYFLLCENKNDLIELIDSKTVKNLVGEQNVVKNNNMGILAKGQLKSNRLSGFIMDDRFSLQNILYDILQEKARGYDRALSSHLIMNELSKRRAKEYKRNFISTILNSMKRTGLIGSSTNGFFYFESKSDIEKSIYFHQSIVDGLNETIKVLNYRLNNSFLD